MLRRNSLKSIAVFMASLFAGKKLNADKATTFISRTTSNGLPVANAYVAILMSCVEDAQKGSKSALDCINMTFDVNRKSFYEKYNISQD